MSNLGQTLLIPAKGAESSGLSYTWTDLGQDSIAAAATSSGKYINSLTVWDGKVFFGYGDINGNAVPHKQRYYDPNDSAFHDSGLGSLQFDMQVCLRTIDGKLYALNGDPNAASPLDDYIVWTAYNSPSIVSDKLGPGLASGLVHGYDLCRHSDGALYMATSGNVGTGAHGIVYKSSNNGTTWAAVYENSTAGQSNLSLIFSYGGYVWAQSKAQSTAVKSTDGVSWADSGIDLMGAAGVYGSQARNFNSKILLVQGSPVQSSIGAVRLFDGVTATTVVSNNMAALAIDNGYIYCACGTLQRSSDGTTWTTLATFPFATYGTVYSLDVVDGVAYIGTSTSHIWKGTPSIVPSTTEWVDEHGSVWVDENGDTWIS